MTSFWRNPVTLVWLLLVIGTGLSWWIGAGGDGMEAQRAWASGGLLVIGAIKVRLIIFYFMEVRFAPLALRLICEAWVLLVALGLWLVFLATAMP